MSIGTSEVQTTYTGDRLQGVAVISQLAIADLEPGCHRFFFQGVPMGTGQHWYVPIVVVKGRQAGPCIALVAGVHGDEVSSIDAVQRTLASLDPVTMAGTVMAVLGLSRPALEYTQSHWPTAQGGGTAIDMNRVWPGDEQGQNAPARHAGLLWNRLLMPNITLAIDYHTVTTGSDFTLFVFADRRQAKVWQMARLFPAEQLKDDPGELGTLETALVTAGIPAMTVEIGGPRRFDPPRVALAVEGTLNVLKHYQIIPGEMGRTANDTDTFVGDAFETIRATTGGFLELFVQIKQPVRPGQRVAVQRNAFGDVVAEYHAGVAGEVAVLAQDALSEPGARIMQILYDRAHPFEA